MKEFSAQTGGRYTYADDLENLQDLALAFGQIFEECDNFIVSGCEVSGESISAGYVYLNGKLRYFSGATGITSWPQYIYENNSTESVTYESGGSKIGRNVYGCAIASSAPTATDVLTGKAPQVIYLSEAGGITMKDAFIGKYALLKDPANSTQLVNSNVVFSMGISTRAGLTSQQPVVIQNGAVKTTLGYNGSTFNILSTGSSNTYQLSMIDGIGFQFYVNSVLVATIGASSITFVKPISAPQGIFGGLALSGNNLFQSTANAVGELGINMLGYSGGETQYRNTYIGNGKGVAVLSVFGENGSVNIDGVAQINTAVIDGFVLKANKLKENVALVNSIAWTDSTNAVMARLGFTSTSDQTFSLSCLLNNVIIRGYSTVNIGPAIMENGVLLSEKYALQTNVTSELAKKANSADVYTQSQANAKFGLQGAGLTQFISDSNTAAVCRTQIGAVGSAELAQCAKISQYLADMATSDEAKSKIRSNIGAAGVDEFQTKLPDTGWIYMKDMLYVRQIGNIVSIQGILKTLHSGTVFTLPNTVQAPTHPVKLTIAFANNKSWTCKIDAGQRACTVVYCDGSCNKNTEFSLTYMV